MNALMLDPHPETSARPPRKRQHRLMADTMLKTVRQKKKNPDVELMLIQEADSFSIEASDV